MRGKDRGLRRIRDMFSKEYSPPCNARLNALFGTCKAGIFFLSLQWILFICVKRKKKKRLELIVRLECDITTGEW
jgi:hypothetical protein